MERKNIIRINPHSISSMYISCIQNNTKLTEISGNIYRQKFFSLSVIHVVLLLGQNPGRYGVVTHYLEGENCYLNILS